MSTCRACGQTNLVWCELPYLRANGRMLVGWRLYTLFDEMHSCQEGMRDFNNRHVNEDGPNAPFTLDLNPAQPPNQYTETELAEREALRSRALAKRERRHGASA